MRLLWRCEWLRPLLIFILFRITEAHLRHISPFELTINSGAIRGERLIIKGEDYTVFKGIPYAMPPVGYLRFQLPKEPAKWRGVMNATQYSAMCVQRMDDLVTEPERHSAHFSEDCLYLNVFSPTPYTNDTYPVMVFIHGGDFQSGGGNDYPQQAILDNFVSRKVIFVTFNYRLGPLGFLSTGDKILPGNIGLWDQIWALKWVKANAESVSSFNSSELLECFRKRMREEILDYRRLHWDDYQEFVPVVDGAGGVIPDIPEDLAKHRKKVPMMIGTTRDESSLRICKY
uniref:COesterase domain-containing protein n=1 Tax=Heterorhabditis bacteriophora TaxID=37862 RepID=A0A1I7X3Y7_HETBA